MLVNVPMNNEKSLIKARRLESVRTHESKTPVTIARRGILMLDCGGFLEAMNLIIVRRLHCG